MPDQASRLPARPSLEHLRKQAKALLHEYRAGDPAAIARLRTHKPTLPGQPGRDSGALADAQFALAREYGFESWPKLKRHVEMVTRPADFYEAKWGRNTWDFLSAVYQGREDQVRARLREDPALARAQYAYLEPLHYAVKAGNADMVRLLLDAGAHPLAPGWSGRPLGDDSPLARARDRERDDLVQLMEAVDSSGLPREAEREEDPLDDRRALENEMSRAAGDGDLWRVHSLLERHPGLAYAGLYEAAHHGMTDTVRLLLEHGADPRKPWRYACWFTPLMHSLRYPEPRWEIAEMLLAHGVSPDDRSGMGIGTLNMIAALGTVPAAAWLLDRGADIHLRDYEFDSTPLAWAARCGREDMVSFLLSRGAAAVHPDDEPWARPEAWARRRGHAGVLKLLQG
jgi:ankyrin repeat protein